jgi:hypothetical protein
LSWTAEYRPDILRVRVSYLHTTTLSEIRVQMFRGLIVIVTAGAVFWHAVAGCCAHHNHGGHSCDAVGKTASLASHRVSEVGGGCCTHARADSESYCASVSSGQRLGEVSPGTHCPKDGPASCREGTCVFAVSNPTGPSALDLVDWDGAFQIFAAFEPMAPFGVSRADAPRGSVAPSSLGGLRLHLAHCVLTL